jgi:predicted nucleotidyltransferase
MCYGLSQKEYEFIYQTVVVPLKAHGAVIWCFGSRARGTHSRFSDLDLMVESQRDLSSIVAEISDQLVNSNFPYKVDLVELNNFAKSYLDNYNKEKVLFS